MGGFVPVPALRLQCTGRSPFSHSGFRAAAFGRLRHAAVTASFPQNGETPMRYGLLLVGLIALAAPAHAEQRQAYVTMVLQAFATKVECPGTDVVYQDLVQKAQEMQMPDGTTEQVRKAIAYMHTGGKMGELQAEDLMSEVALATKTTDLDQKRIGMTAWCETQKSKLAGFIRTKN
jgi:hypothetical protein